MGVSFNKRLTASMFREKIEPYREVIMARDESFFLDRELNVDHVTEDVGIERSELYETIASLKLIWQHDITDEQRSAIWKCLQQMIILTDAM